MRVFVINLQRDRDRFLKIAAQCAAFGVEYERFDAIDGSGVSDNVRRRSLDRFRWWCAIGRSITDGELGVALSHMGIYQKMIKEALPYICILEDDVVLDPRFRCVLAQVALEAGDGSRSEVYLLSNHSDPNGQLGNSFEGFRSPELISKVVFKPTLGDMFAEAYVITNHAAREILKANMPIRTPCDWWGRWVGLGRIKLYHVFPTVCQQNKYGFASHTVVGMADAVSCIPLGRRLFHKLKRIVGKSIDVALMRLLRS